MANKMFIFLRSIIAYRCKGKLRIYIFVYDRSVKFRIFVAFRVTRKTRPNMLHTLGNIMSNIRILDPCPMGIRITLKRDKGNEKNVHFCL